MFPRHVLGRINSNYSITPYRVFPLRGLSILIDPRRVYDPVEVYSLQKPMIFP